MEKSQFQQQLRLHWHVQSTNKHSIQPLLNPYTRTKEIISIVASALTDAEHKTIVYCKCVCVCVRNNQSNKYDGTA